nr:hypothetical protein [Tanacetum cinerariifolium]
APPSPDYILGPEEPEQAPPSPDYVPGPEHVDDEIVAEDQPYAEDASPNAQSPEYVPESDLEAHPEDDDDEDPEEDPADEEEEEHPAPADSVVVASIAADQAHLRRRLNHLRLMSLQPHHRHTLHITTCYIFPTSITIIPLFFTTTSDSFPPLPPILSPPSPVLSIAPPPSPIQLLRTDHRRSTEVMELRTTLQGQVTALQGQVPALQAHVTALQGQQGLAGGPTQPELPE